jgi:hypothetical protein
MNQEKSIAKKKEMGSPSTKGLLLGVSQARTGNHESHFQC